MATPGRAAERLGKARAKAAARPPARAIDRSMGLGSVRASSSRVSSSLRREAKGRKPFSQVSTKARRTASTAPRINEDVEPDNSLVSPVMEARPIPMIGDMSGATSMAPIIVAGESISKPSVAIVAESSTKRKKSKLGSLASRRRTWTSARSSRLIGGTSRRQKRNNRTRIRLTLRGIPPVGE